MTKAPVGQALYSARLAHALAPDDCLSPDAAVKLIADVVQALLSRGHSEAMVGDCLRSVAGTINPPRPPARRGTNKASTRQYDQLLDEIWAAVRSGRSSLNQAKLIAEASRMHAQRYGMRADRSIARTLQRRLPGFFRDKANIFAWSLARDVLFQMGALPRTGTLNEQQGAMVVKLVRFMVTNGPNGSGDTKGL